MHIPACVPSPDATPEHDAARFVAAPPGTGPGTLDVTAPTRTWRWLRVLPEATKELRPTPLRKGLAGSAKRGTAQLPGDGSGGLPLHATAPIVCQGTVPDFAAPDRCPSLPNPVPPRPLGCRGFGAAAPRDPAGPVPSAASPWPLLQPRHAPRDARRE